MRGPHPGAKADEHALWASIQSRVLTPREAGALLGMPPKRIESICLKWARNRIYNYGVSVDLGWPDVQPPAVSCTACGHSSDLHTSDTPEARAVNGVGCVVCEQLVAAIGGGWICRRSHQSIVHLANHP